jgi:lysozyme
MAVIGIDTSHWEGEIDWKAASQEIRFAILKATEGGYYRDDTYLTNKSGCIQAGVPHGAYHFFRSNQDPVRQAQNFTSAIGGNMKVLVADVETMDGGDLKANLRIFMSKVEEITGVIPMVYTSPGFWNSYGIQDPVWCKKYHLWVAHWTTAPNPILPRYWTCWDIWQTTDKGEVDGVDGYVDMDKFNGTDEEMRAYFGNGGPPPLSKLEILWREAQAHGWNLEP